MTAKVVNIHSVSAVQTPRVSDGNPTMCYHCGLVVPKQAPHYLVVDGVQQPMCCMGCVAVAELLMEPMVEQCSPKKLRVRNLGR